jgi:hypothetical protein
MTRDEIKQTIDEYLLLVQKGCGSTQENEAKLRLLLDKLAMARHFASYKFDAKDYADTPERGGPEWRKTVTVQFPNYGFYNIPEEVTMNVGNGACIVGCAIDDIMDIAADLFEAKWRWENNSIEDGLWHFQNQFVLHWGRHLRDLQLYLFNLEQGT